MAPGETTPQPGDLESSGQPMSSMSWTPKSSLFGCSRLTTFPGATGGWEDDEFPETPIVGWDM